MEYIKGTEHEKPLVPKPKKQPKQKHIMHVDRCIMHADIKREEQGKERIKTMHRLANVLATDKRDLNSTYHLLYRYKSGVVKPDHDFIEQVRAYLDVDINDLYFVE